MRILVVGGGGREHAICWKLCQDDPDVELHAAPGNPGIEAIATCHPVPVTDLAGLVALGSDLGADLVVIGPEGPLDAGLADLFRARGMATFGPSAAAARIESSKSYAKNLMRKHGIPTAGFEVHTSITTATASAGAFGFPVVVKASGLAAGKGVIISGSLADAKVAIGDVFRLSIPPEVVMEEFMQGEELSVFAVCDGENAILLLPSQDHKRLLDGDEGPNTGGMGAYAPVSIATSQLMERVSAEIIHPILRALADDGAPFMGLLYAGLMITPDGSPKVVEFNCRFGDPETQVVLPLMQTPLVDLLLAATRRGGLKGVQASRFSQASAATTIIAAPGYPSSPVTGTRIAIPSAFPEGTYVFHAGTKRDTEGNLVTAGGRVFSVTGVGHTLDAALERSQAALRLVSFEGMQYRKDIGWREKDRVIERLTK